MEGFRSSVGDNEGDADDVREIDMSSSFPLEGGGLLKEELETFRECGGRSEIGDVGPDDLGALISLKMWTVSEAEETQRRVDVALKDML